MGAFLYCAKPRVPRLFAGSLHTITHILNWDSYPILLLRAVSRTSPHGRAVQNALFRPAIRASLATVAWPPIHVVTRETEISNSTRNIGRIAKRRELCMRTVRMPK